MTTTTSGKRVRLRDRNESDEGKEVFPGFARFEAGTFVERVAGEVSYVQSVEYRRSSDRPAITLVKFVPVNDLSFAIGPTGDSQ